MERLREILAFVNHKGGVGKTTTVQTLAAGLRRYGAGHFGRLENGNQRQPRILIIDLDPQSCASFLFGWSETQQTDKPNVYDDLINQRGLSVYQVREGIYLAPASKRLIGIDPFLNQMPSPRKALTKILSKPIIEMQGTELYDEFVAPTGVAVDHNIVECFDYVLIDCPPAMSLLTHNAMTVASGIVIPVQLEALATKGLAEILAEARITKEELNEDLEIRGLLMVMSNDQTKATKEFKAFLGEKYEGYLFDAYVRRDTKMVECQAMNQDIFAYAPYSRVGMDYEKFTKEIINTYKED